MENINENPDEKPENIVRIAEEKKVSDRAVRKIKVGKVISNKMNKTVVIGVSYFRKHRLYGKIMKRTTKLKVHDEKNECSVGDVIKVMETRPISKEKRWRIVKIIEKVV
ncbi:MAG: 30S ribosomal protein S17 [Candidatus Improbicoccus devescovinae]|nr:MAG: 30S ribosomal protein S17 [Candidatus Improbicoccus devescovinae]